MDAIQQMRNEVLELPLNHWELHESQADLAFAQCQERVVCTVHRGLEWWATGTYCHWDLAEVTDVELAPLEEL